MFFLFYVFFKEISCEKVTSFGQSFDVLFCMDSGGTFEPSSHRFENSFLFILNTVFYPMDWKYEFS